MGRRKRILGLHANETNTYPTRRTSEKRVDDGERSISRAYLSVSEPDNRPPVFRRTRAQVKYYGVSLHSDSRPKKREESDPEMRRQQRPNPPLMEARTGDNRTEPLDYRRRRGLISSTSTDAPRYPSIGRRREGHGKNSDGTPLATGEGEPWMGSRSASEIQLRAF